MYHPPVYFTPKQFLKTLVMIHLMFTIAVFSFAIVASIISDGWKFNWNFMEDPFMIIVIVFAVSGILFSNFMFRKQLESIKLLTSLKEKLARYQSAVIIKMAFVEAPGLFAITVFIISGNLLYLILAMVLLVFLFALRPTKEALENDLKLNSEMRARFRNGDEIVL